MPEPTPKPLTAEEEVVLAERAAYLDRQIDKEPERLRLDVCIRLLCDDVRRLLAETAALRAALAEAEKQRDGPISTKDGEWDNLAALLEDHAAYGAALDRASGEIIQLKQSHAAIAAELRAKDAEIERLRGALKSIDDYQPMQGTGLDWNIKNLRNIASAALAQPGATP